MKEEKKTSHSKTGNPDSWKKFDATHKKATFGAKVAIIQNLACRLFKTDPFKKVLAS
jgi:hypothetical protein